MISRATNRTISRRTGRPHRAFRESGPAISKSNRSCRSALAESLSRCKTRSTNTCATTKFQPCYQSGQQYSITALTDSSGTIKERYAYRAYGTPTITDASGTIRATTAEGNRYTYTGREWDEDVELYHYRARVYEPLTGRFCSRDPIGFEDGQSLYRAYFVPSKLDPMGKDCTLVGPAGPATVSRGYGAFGANMSVNFASNPGVWDKKPAQSIKCCRGYLQTFAYACCCDGKKTGRQVTVVELDCFDEPISAGKHPIMALNLTIPLTRPVPAPGPGLVLMVIDPADFARADALCKRASGKRRPPNPKPVPVPQKTIAC